MQMGKLKKDVIIYNEKLLFYDVEGCPCSEMVSIGRCAALEFQDSRLGEALATTSAGELGTLTNCSPASDESVGVMTGSSASIFSPSSVNLSSPRPSNSCLRGSTFPRPESNVDAPLAVVGVRRKLEGSGETVDAVSSDTSVDALVGVTSGYGLFKLGSKGMFCRGVGLRGREPTLPEPLPRLEMLVSVTSGGESKGDSFSLESESAPPFSSDDRSREPEGFLVLEPSRVPNRQRSLCRHAFFKPRLTTTLTNMRMTMSENSTAVMMPMVTRGMGLTSNFGTNANNIPAAMTRATASVTASTSPPRVS